MVLLSDLIPRYSDGWAAARAVTLPQQRSLETWQLHGVECDLSKAISLFSATLGLIPRWWRRLPLRKALINTD